jgi:hypothetical protein
VWPQIGQNRLVKVQQAESGWQPVWILTVAAGLIIGFATRHLVPDWAIPAVLIGAAAVVLLRGPSDARFLVLSVALALAATVVAAAGIALL